MRAKLIVGIGILCAIAFVTGSASASVVSNVGYTIGHSFTWGWVDDGNYNLVAGDDHIDFIGIKVVSGPALEGPSPIALSQDGWTSSLIGNGTACASGPTLIPNYTILLTNIGTPTNTIVNVAAFSGGTLVGAIELSSDDPYDTWHFINNWSPSESDFGTGPGTNVPEPATLIVWSLFGAIELAGNEGVARRTADQPAFVVARESSGHPGDRRPQSVALIPQRLGLAVELPPHPRV